MRRIALSKNKVTSRRRVVQHAVRVVVALCLASVSSNAQGQTSPSARGVSADSLSPSSTRNYVPAESKVREQALIDSIMQLLPSDDQRIFQRVLRTGGGAGAPSFEKPEVKQLMTQLMWLYNGPPVGAKSPGQIEADRARAANLTHVRIALVPANMMQGERILLVRSASDDGQPLILLHEADGTDLEARAGVRAATTSLREFAKWTAAESKQPIKVSNYKTSELTGGTIIDELKTNVPPHELTGFGMVRLTRVLVKRNPAL